MADSSQNRLRCKPGDRARIISSPLNQNLGKVVVVVRPYQNDEIIDCFPWVADGFAWVVVSLGAPLATYETKTTKTDLKMTAVLEDARLMPLHDDEAGIEDAAVRAKPRRKTASA